MKDQRVIDLIPFFHSYLDKLDKLDLDKLDKRDPHNLPASLPVTGVCFDSRKVVPGNVFVCLPGEHTDGNKFIIGAVNNGAACVVTQQPPTQLSTPTVVVTDAYKALADIADYFYDHPSRQLRLIGITGTNGKTTATHLVQHIFNTAGLPTGLIGTIGTRLPSSTEYQDTKLTTPQSSEVHRLLFEMLQEQCKYVSMEVSSHALVQNRVRQCRFAVAALTNITQDHLDFHKTMENYTASKLLLFQGLNDSELPDKSAVINLDDEAAPKFLQACNNSIKKLTYSWDKNSDVRVISNSYNFQGSQLKLSTPLGRLELETKLAGKFNVYNIMTAVTIAIAEGISLADCARALNDFSGVPGRFQIATTGAANEPLCIVDFAHSPDGLENVLKTARDLVPPSGKLIVVFGCGGDRDTSKRPKMGKIAETEADIVVATSDNPRSEDPQRIITDVLSGMNHTDKIQVEPDRAAAIRLAISKATDKDVIVVAGKGHENYQILVDRTILFNDRSEVLAALKERGGMNQVK